MGNLKNIAVLISGSGTVCNSICNSCNNGVLKGIAQVPLVISTSNESSFFHMIKISEYKGAYFYMPWENSEQWHYQMYDLMSWYNIDLICLAGFLKKIQVWTGWENKILNTHPSLLPKFGGKGMYGLHVHQAVIDNKEKETGCTIHVVNNEYDEGRIIAQKSLDLSNFSPSNQCNARYIELRVKSMEYELYPVAIQNYIKEQYPKS